MNKILILFIVYIIVMVLAIKFANLIDHPNKGKPKWMKGDF